MIPPLPSMYKPMAGDEPWGLPFGLAIGLHVLVFLLILFPPTFLLPRRDVPEVQTINLFDAGDLNQPAASGPKQVSASVTPKGGGKEVKREEPKPEPTEEEAKPPAPEPPKPEPPKPEPVPEPPKPIPPPEPPKPVPEPPKPEPVPEPPKPVPEPPKEAISLSPKKIKKKVVEEKPKPEKAAPPSPPPLPNKTEAAKAEAKNEVKILKSLERIQAKVKEKQDNQAIKAKLTKIRDSLHDIAAGEAAGPATGGAAAPGAGGPSAGGTASSGAGGGGSMLDEALKKYYIAISRKIHSVWSLPETQDWDANLEAIAVIVIKRDGTVVETIIEKKSANIHFDQYVEKALKAALPLPPFPSDLKEDELEIGLKFRPSGLF